MKKDVWQALYPMGYRILYAVLLVSILLSGLGDFFGISKVGVCHLFFAVVLLILLIGINYGKTNGKIISGILMLFCIIFLVPFVGAGQIQGFWMDYFCWLIGQEGYQLQWLLGYELLQMLLIVLGGYGLAILVEKKQIVKDLLALLILIAILICMLRKIEMSHGSVIFAMLFIMLSFIERTRMNWKKRKERDKREYLLGVIFFCMVYMVLLFFAPVEKEPYDWKFLRDMYSRINKKITILVEDIKKSETEDFALSMEGISEDGGLVSQLLKNDRELMTINGDPGLITNIYLTGKIYNTFTGRQWQKENLENAKEYPIDTLETCYAIKKYAQVDSRDYIRIADLKIGYEYFHSGYVFSPLKLVKLEDMEYQTEGREFLFKEKKGYGTTYKLSYYQLNVKELDWNKMLQIMTAEQEEVWKNVVQSHTLGKRGNYSLADLEQYQKAMKEHYFQEVSLSEEVRVALAKITENCKTDIEKLQAIENALSTYEYTKNPGKLPQWVNSQETFLEYFLLEGQKGYCSHFATAFVLLARAEGFPARYVEGFCVPYKNTKEMKVTGNMVHAWPEVYIKGIGWLPFEPTPGYKDTRYTGWEVADSKGNNTEKTVKRVQTSDSSVDVKEPVEVNGTEAHQKDVIGQGILWSIFLFIAFLIIERVIERAIFKRRYHRLTTTQKFLVVVRRMMWIFARLGYRRLETETLREWQERVREAFPQLLPETSGFVFIRGYEEYLYRGGEVSVEMLCQTIEEKRALLLWLREERKWQYYMIKIFPTKY